MTTLTTLTTHNIVNNIKYKGDEMTTHLLGTRGSTLLTDDQCKNYGWHTQCAAVPLDDRLIIFDAGTGIFNARKLLSDYKNVDIFLTHYHLDHLSSLLMFSGFHVSDMTIRIFAPDYLDKTAETIINETFSPPLWPITIKQVNANVTIHSINHGDIVSLGKSSIESHKLTHPNDAYGYKLTQGDKKLIYLFDHEANLNEINIDDFIAGCDLLICDAPYTESEYKNFKGYGHSSIEAIIKLVSKTNVKRTIVSHHSPFKTDEEIDEYIKKYPEVVFGKEGDIYTV